MTSPAGVLGPLKKRQLNEAGFICVREDRVVQGWVNEDSLARYVDEDDKRRDIRVERGETEVHAVRVQILLPDDQTELPLEEAA